MNKAPDAFRTISEVADELDLFGTNRSELSLSAMTDGESVGGGEHSEETGPETVPQKRSGGEALRPTLPLAATGSAAAGSAAVVSQPSGLAPEDLDRLRAALAALEACSRLLDESRGA